MTNRVTASIAAAWAALSTAERLVALIALVWPFRNLLNAISPVDLHLGAVSFAALGVYVLARVRRLPHGFPGALDVAMLVFVAIAALDLALLGDSWSRSLKGFTFETRFVIFYFIARLLALGMPLARWLLGQAMVFGILAALIGLVEYHSQWGWLLQATGLTSDSRFWKGGIPRLYSFAMVPLSAAYLEVLALSAVLWAASAGLATVTWIVTVMLLWQALPLTLSRSAITVALLLTFAYAIAGGKNGRRFAAVSLAAMLAGGLVYAARGWDRPIAKHAAKSATLSDSSAKWHGHAVLSGADLIRARPLGHGLGEAGYVAKERGGLYRWNETHYVTIAVQMGIPGALAFLAILAIAGARWWREARAVDRERRAIGFAGLALFTALALGGLFHATWNMIVPQLWFWLLTAIVVNEAALRSPRSGMLGHTPGPR